MKLLVTLIAIIELCSCIKIFDPYSIITWVGSNGENEIVYEEYIKADEKNEGIKDENWVKVADAVFVDYAENVYTLDSYTQRVICNGECFCELGESVLPCDLVIVNKNIYVYDEILNEIHIYNLETDEVQRVEIDIKNDYFKNLILVSGTPCIRTVGMKHYMLNTSDNTIHGVDIKTPEVIPQPEFEIAEFIKTDIYGRVYSLQGNIYNGSILCGDVVLVREDSYKNEVVFYEIPQDCVYLPVKPIFIDDFGNTYVLQVFEDKTTLTEISYVDNIELHNKVNLKYAVGGSRLGEVSLDREQSLERAIEINNFEWILNNKNTRVDTENETLPREIEYYAKINESQKEWEQIVDGVPYCWGGFNDIYSSVSWRNFNILVNDYGYLAGNTKAKGNYKEGTAGLDCSGYSSVVYGMSQKYSTRTLFDISKSVSKLEDMKLMDMFVSPGDHVIHYYRMLGDNDILVNETCARDGKSLTQSRSLFWFLVDGTYQMRTPWND